MDYYYYDAPPAEPEEAIYNWIKEEVRVPPKAARHVSKFKGSAEVAGSTLKVKKAKSATFGRQGVKPNPKQFLKGGSKMGRGATRGARPAKFTRADPPRKPAVPHRDERPVYGLKTSKNFVVSNAVENILAAPRVKNTGGPDYRNKADYGKVPAYLGDVKEQIAQEQEMIAEMLAANDGGSEYEQVVELSEADRADLIRALKDKWDAVNAQYQLITFKRISSSNSTVGAVKRKEDCEAQLAQLEKDIERLSAKGPVLVVDA